MNQCPHTRIKIFEWQGLKTTQCQDCGDILATPTAEEGLSALRNHENGLPPGLQEILHKCAQHDEERVMFQEVLDRVLRDKARKDFMARYGEDDPFDEDVSVGDMERLMDEMQKRKQQQQHN